jgi:beta-glucosidase
MAIQEGGARALMAAYNKYNGIPCVMHPILDDIVQQQWGQDGIICTDGGAYRLLVTAHKQFQSYELAAAATLDAGISQFLDKYADGVEAALQKKLILEADIDRALRKNFRVMIRLGLLDPPERVPYSQIGEEPEEPWERPAHQESVRRVTQKSIVLLKNEDDLLPLDAAALSRVAIIGPLADRVLVDWYSGTPPYTVSPVDGLRERLGFDRVLVSCNNDPSDAVRIAKKADVAIVCVGNHPTGDHAWAKVTKPSFGKEAVDRQSVHLEDEELVKRVLAANPNTIVVLISSFPYAIEWTVEHAPAIVHLSHASQELGRALADVLFGDYNPGGRLVHTWPRSIVDLPPLTDYDLRKGHTYQYFKGDPLFPFGHGLSYTRFTYSRLLISSRTITEETPITVTCDITNIGPIAGDEVVQLYARFLDSAVRRPKMALVGFCRVGIEPDETKRVEFRLVPRQLMHWDAALDRWLLETGPIELRVGRSSANAELVCTIEAREQSSMPPLAPPRTSRPADPQAAHPSSIPGPRPSRVPTAHPSNLPTSPTTALPSSAHPSYAPSHVPPPKSKP